MHCFTKQLIFTLLIVALNITTVFAQRDYLRWQPEDGVAIRQGDYIEWFRASDCRTEGQLASEVAFVWSDCRNGDRGVFIQVIDADGQFKFDQNGLQVVDGVNRQEDPVVCASNNGGWFIAWEDFDVDSLGDIYCTKINAQGERIWGENETGVPVCVHEGIQEDIYIVDDLEGGCIIAWRDKRNGDIGDIYAMHITGDGEPDDRWVENGTPIVIEDGPQTHHETISDGAGGMILCWRDGRINGDFNIWAQRITPDGDLLWGDDESVQVCNHRFIQESPRICPDGHGGAFITWVDDRNARESDKDIYAQRVDADGNLMWGNAGEGEPVCTAEEEQSGNRIVLSEPGTAIIVWEDMRENGQEYDIYAMRITGEDEMEKTWQPEQGVVVSAVERNQSQVRLCPDGEGGAYFVWEDEQHGGFPEIDIWAQRLDSDGRLLWDEEGIVVCEGLGMQHSTAIQPAADGGCVIAWGDHRTGSSQLFCQRLSPEGEEVWDENGIPLVEGISGNAFQSKLISCGNGDFVIIWLDGRFGGRGHYPFIQFCRDTGDEMEILLEQDGIPILSGTLGGGWNPDAILNENGETIVVWEDHRHGQLYSIYVQKISEDGDLLWGESGIHCTEFNLEQEAPKVCSDGEGGAIVAWRASNERNYTDLFIQRVNRLGVRQWGDEGIALTGDNETDENFEAIIPDGQGGVILLWIVNSREMGDDLWIERIDPNGEPMWGDDGVVICQEQNDQHRAKLIRHENGFVVFWEDGRDDENGQSQYDIYGQFIEPDGNFRWREGGSLICLEDEFNQGSPAVTIDNNGHIWVAWDDYRSGGPPRRRDIYIQKLSAQVDEQGDPVILFRRNDEPIRNGIPVCTANGDQVHPEIIHDAHNGVWIVWEDYRNGVWSDIYGTHLRPDGTHYEPWEVGGNLICGAIHRQNRPQLSLLRSDGETGAVVVWEDKRATGIEELFNIYCQRLDDDMVAVDEKENRPIPVQFAIEDVYPNPFNAQTIVTYVASREEFVKIELYDVTGRLVRQLSNKKVSAGRYSLPINAGNLAAGSYIVRLEAGAVTIEREITVVK